MSENENTGHNLEKTLKITKIIWSFTAVLSFSIVAFLGAQFLQSSDANGNPQDESQSQIVTSDFKDWRMVCEKKESNLENCRIFQVISNNEKQQILFTANVTFRPHQDGGKVPVLRLIAPIGINLASGLALRIDEAEQMNAPFTRCLPAGCFTEIMMGEEFLKSLKNGEVMRAAYGVPSGEPLTVGLSLKGFTQAIKALESQSSDGS